MRIHNKLFFLSAFFLMLLAFACTSDSKVEAGALSSVDDEKIASAITETIVPTPAAPTAEEIAAAEAAKAAEEKAKEEALKAEKKKAKEEKARKERRRKRREKRKKIAAEKAAAEKLALREAAEAAANMTTPTSREVNYQSVKAPIEEDLSDIDPNLLDVVQAKSNGGTPRIRFDSESYDFGRIIQGKEIDHEFEFTNTGSAPLVINNVEVTCGCTTPFYPFIPIEPGERGKISVHFSSKGRLGNQTPTITVYTNTDPGTFELHLKGLIDTEREGQ